MTSRKSGGALGRGLDALIRSEKVSNDDEKQSEGTIDIKEKKKARKKPEKKDKTVEAVIQEVHKNPRISLWSARSAAVLRFLKKTRPEFSISKEASSLIEAAVEEKYPEIWEKFKQEDLK